MAKHEEKLSLTLPFKPIFDRFRVFYPSLILGSKPDATSFHVWRNKAQNSNVVSIANFTMLRAKLPTLKNHAYKKCFWYKRDKVSIC